MPDLYSACAQRRSRGSQDRANFRGYNSGQKQVFGKPGEDASDAVSVVATSTCRPILAPYGKDDDGECRQAHEIRCAAVLDVDVGRSNDDLTDAQQREGRGEGQKQ